MWRIELKKIESSYKETIKGNNQGQGKYKKQSGGKGQYGDTWLELSPFREAPGLSLWTRLLTIEAVYTGS